MRRLGCYISSQMLTPIEKIDLFLRFATIGQICLITVLLLCRRPVTTRLILAILIAPCMVAYLILTAPGVFAEVEPRGLIMSLVHSLPFFAWILIADILNERPGFFSQPASLGFAIAAIVIINVIVFWVADAPAVLHQVSHWMAIALLIHLLILVVHGKSDDLLPARRRMRAWFVGIFATQFLVIVAVEITGLGLGNPQVTNAINASIIFLVVMVLGIYWAGQSIPVLLASDDSATAGSPEPVHDAIQSKDRALYERLKAFMDDGGYSTTDLSIRNLSSTLSAPEHQLRKLINQGLGYRNVSTFLNTYRINSARERLVDPAEAHIPVLTVALDLGYGSIGPFNRAFKSITGMTPTEYRRFQNRP